MKKIKKLHILSVVSLLAGGFLYLATRPDAHISVFIDKIIPLEEIQTNFLVLKTNVIKYYVPDFLWAFSFTCALLTINQNIKLVVSLASLSGMLWEGMQFTGIISGTGDAIDIIMYLTAVFIAVLINKKECSDYEKEQN